MWPRLKNVLDQLPRNDQVLHARPSAEDMLREILELIRADAATKQIVSVMTSSPSALPAGAR